ncbi:MAG: NeuD/PglB/VioB family sugar acetyltransferase [Blastocatellia bacterium]
MTKALLIRGSGTFALETLDIAENAGGFAPIGFLNSLERQSPDATHAGLPVFWIDDAPFGPHDCYLVAGIVSTRRRKLIETVQARGFRFVSVIHPSAMISRRFTIGDGCVINAGVVVSHNAAIDAHVILNRGALIGHDNRIGQFCTVGPGANVAGGNVIGQGAYIGEGVVVRDHLSVGAEAVVGAGAVVVKPVPANSLVAGVPARVIRTGVNGL